MPAQNDKLSEIKSILRSHLISAANTSVTLRQLNGLYRDMEERNIPFREFGYASLLGFLKSIGDTVKLYTNVATGEICVKHVETNLSAHVSSLVSRQKPKRPAKKKAISRPIYRPSSNYNYSSCAQRQSSTAYRKPNVYSKPTSNGMFSGIGNNKFSSNLTNNNVGNYNSRPTNSFVTNAANSCYRPTNGYPTNTTSNCNNSKPINNYSSATSNTYSTSTLQPYKDAVPILKTVLSNMKYKKTTTGIRKADLLANVKKELRDTGRDPNAVYSMQNLNNDLMELSDKVEVKEDYIYFIDELAIAKEQERRKLKENNVVTTSNCKNESFKSISGEQTPNKSFAKESSFSKTLDENVEAMEFTTVSCPKSPSMISCVNDLIKDTTKFRLQKLIENHPEGIWCSELPHVYKKEYNLDLEYHELGFTNVTEFVTVLPEIFQVATPLDNIAMVLNAKQPICDSSNSYQKKTLASVYNFDDYVAKDPEPVPITLRPMTSEKLFPDGVMKPNETVDIISVVTLSTMEYLEVNISEIFTPSFFWVTLRENKKKFKAMMNDLDEFYRLRDLDSYRVPQVLLKTGLNIACIYSNIWHRGIIKKVKPDGYVLILFYDYGTISTYHPSDIFFLHTRFSALPAQAIAAGLTTTSPIGSLEWSTDRTRAFVDRVWNIPMIAMVASINEMNNTMMITLTDTTDDENDVHINDWMVDNNLAVWGKMIKDVPFDTMILYDEMYCGHRNSSSQKEKKKSGTKSSSAVSKGSNSNDTESFHTASSMASFVQETMGYVKQTHTITQAILLNTPINKFDDVSNCSLQDQINGKLERKSFVSNGFANMEICNAAISPQFNSNLSSFKSQISLSNNYSETESIQNEYQPLNQVLRKKVDNELPVSGTNENGYVELRSVNQNSQHLKNVSNHGSPIKQADQNGYAESYYNGNQYIRQPPSTHSTSSYKSDCSQSINVDVNDNYDRFNLQDGTLSFEKVVEPKNPTIEIKYPSKFAAIIENNTNLLGVNSNGNIKLHDEVDDGYNTGSRQSSTRVINGSTVTCSTPPPAPVCIDLELSETCDNKLFHILHFENNGWACMNEVADAFTNYYDERVVIKLIQVFEYDIDIRYSTRETDPQLFFKLDESKFNAPRDEKNKIVSDFVLTLITLKDMVTLLIKLEFIDANMVREALPLMKKPKTDNEDTLYRRFRNKYLYNVLNVFLRYREFKHAQSSK